MPDLDVTWQQADPALVRCLELAHESFLARGLPVGSVIVTAGGATVTAGGATVTTGGATVSEGRNRAYDPAGGPAPLQRTPIAHAEMNALAGIETGTDLAQLTLWSSHQPCQMCAAACSFTGVGRVVFIAPDPSDDDPAPDPDGIAPEWVVIANLLFLSGVAAYSGPSSPMIARAGTREPEITALMRQVGDATLRQPTLRQPTLRDALAPLWPAIQAAATDRRARQNRTP